MNMDERIKKINELYHKSQTSGLNEEEKALQAKLRREYIDSIRGALRSQLDNIDIKEADGSVTNLGEQARKREAQEAFDNSESDHLGNIRTKKALIRKEMIEQRKLMKQEELESKSALICDTIISMDEYKNASVVFLYEAYNNEVLTDLIFESARKDGKKVAYPKTILKEGNTCLEFYLINDKQELSEGYKGILEPDIDNRSLVKVTECPDLVIVPGVAFDKKCHRIGYGKAFYDRFLQNNDVKSKIGICFDFQIKDFFETEKEDIPVDKVVSEKNIYCL